MNRTHNITQQDVQRRAFALEGQLSGIDIRVASFLLITPRRWAMIKYVYHHAPEHIRQPWEREDISTLEAFTQMLQEEQGRVS